MQFFKKSLLPHTVFSESDQRLLIHQLELQMNTLNQVSCSATIFQKKPKLHGMKGPCPQYSEEKKLAFKVFQ